jgi:Domain of unknown function (DUF4350)
MDQGRKQRTAVIIGLALVFSLFAWGTLKLFLLRFESGDIYPEYSSLRTDPLGTKAFYEALGRLPGVTTRRNQTPLRDVARTGPATLLFIGAQPSGSDDAPRALVDAFEAVAVEGGRVVLAFYPYGQEPWHLRESDEDDKDEPADEDGAEDEESAGETSPDAAEPDVREPVSTVEVEDPEEPESDGDTMKPEPGSGENGEDAVEEGDEDDEDDVESREDRLARYRRTVDLAQRWGISTDFEPLPEEEDAYKTATAHRQADLPLPKSIPCHSALYFTELNDAWTVLYARDSGNAVLVERQWGRGSLVLCADAYLFSNEAMRVDRRPDLLAWFVGSSATVVFDETHFGIAERQGVMTLARKYRLHGVLASLVLLAMLFVWKNAVSLVPRTVPGAEADVAADVFTGKDAASGLANLLRRSVSPGDLPKACLREYEKSLGHREGGTASRAAKAMRAVSGGAPRLTDDQVNRMRAVVAGDDTVPGYRRDPAGRYRDLCRIVNERKPGKAAAVSEPARRTTERV